MTFLRFFVHSYGVTGRILVKSQVLKRGSTCMLSDLLCCIAVPLDCVVILLLRTLPVVSSSNFQQLVGAEIKLPLERLRCLRFSLLSLEQVSLGALQRHAFLQPRNSAWLLSPFCFPWFSQPESFQILLKQK